MEKLWGDAGAPSGNMYRDEPSSICIGIGAPDSPLSLRRKTRVAKPQ
jgi:hypothetical protein